MKRLLSIMLVLMLVLSIAATAFAVDGKVDPTTPSAYITKEYIAGPGHAATFRFNVTPITTGKNVPQVIFAPIAFAANETGIVTKTSELTLGTGTVNAAGTYEYTVTEAQDEELDNDTEKLDCSDAQYKLTLTINEQNGALAITGITVTKTHNDDGTEISPADQEKVEDPNGFKFVNSYAKKAADLKISKRVVNGDNDKEFSFGFNYEASGNFSPFNITVTHSRLGNIPQTTKQYNFVLKNDEYVIVSGLPVGTEVIVTEAYNENYKASAKTTFGTTEQTINSPSGTASLRVTGTMAATNNSVTVTNTHDSYTPPTGVILNVLPYVLMVAIAGGMIVLFTAMKRRKAQDNNED